MKKILKILSLIFVCAFTLFGACACRNSVSDMRRRERLLHERQRQEERQRLLEEENVQEDEPDLTENPDEPERKRKDGEEQNPLYPDHGKLDPRFQKPSKPNPVPFPMPRD